jgi:hypothetical protein
MSNVEESQGYFVHLRLEHRKLEGVLQRIKLTWFTPDDDNQVQSQAPSLSDVLQTLRSNLAEHFAEEQEGGCLEEAVCRCPRLGPEANRIESEHTVLLAELDGLIRRSQSEVGDSQSGGQTRFDLFAARLHAHEAAENHILEVAFGLEAEQ